MASALHAEDLTCSVCLSIFTEPVTLTCGHSFCRGCIAALPAALCPQCRAVYASVSALEQLPTSHTLNMLAEKAKERPQQRPGPEAAEEPWLCPEHEERMKLFCVTDQRLACIICRDGEAHDGHRFKPIREAAAALRRDIDGGLVNAATQIKEIQNLMQTQSGEMKKAKELSAKLKSQVQQQFEAMQQFLRRRQDQILNELRVQEQDAVENMSDSLNKMNEALSECEEQRQSWTQITEVSDPEMFLRRWSKEHSNKAAKDLLKTWTRDLAVVPSPLFEGPHQSHLQFFMWKELLQMVEPKADLLTLQDDNPCLAVSADRRSFHYAPQNWQNFHPAKFVAFAQSLGHVGSSSYTSHYGIKQPFTHKVPTQAFTFGTTQAGASNVPQSFAVSSSSGFSSGQHYWEVEVRLRDFWCVGITDYFLKYENQKYFLCVRGRITEVSVSGRLLKLGLYLNCSSKTLTFYDADSMVCLQKVSCDGLTFPVSAFFAIQQKEPDTNPITICRY